MDFRGEQSYFFEALDELCHQVKRFLGKGLDVLLDLFEGGHGWALKIKNWFSLL